MAVLCKSLILFRGLYPNTCLCSMESVGSQQTKLILSFFMAVLPYGQLVTCETFVAKCSLQKYLEALQFLLVEDLNLCF